MVHQRYCTRQHKLERSTTFSRLRQVAMDLLAGSLKVKIAAIFNQASAPQSPWFQSINMLVTLAYHCIWRHSACWHWSYLCKWKHLKVSTDNAWILIWIMAWSRMQVLGVGIQWPHWINILKNSGILIMWEYSSFPSYAVVKKRTVDGTAHFATSSRNALSSGAERLSACTTHTRARIGKQQYVFEVSVEMNLKTASPLEFIDLAQTDISSMPVPCLRPLFLPARWSLQTFAVWLEQMRNHLSPFKRKCRTWCSLRWKSFFWVMVVPHNWIGWWQGVGTVCQQWMNTVADLPAWTTLLRSSWCW